MTLGVSAKYGGKDQDGAHDNVTKPLSVLYVYHACARTHFYCTIADNILPFFSIQYSEDTPVLWAEFSIGSGNLKNQGMDLTLRIHIMVPYIHINDTQFWSGSSCCLGLGIPDDFSLVIYWRRD